MTQFGIYFFFVLASASFILLYQISDHRHLHWMNIYSRSSLLKDEATQFNRKVRITQIIYRILCFKVSIIYPSFYAYIIYLSLPQKNILYYLIAVINILIYSSAVLQYSYLVMKYIWVFARKMKVFDQNLGLIAFNLIVLKYTIL